MFNIGPQELLLLLVAALVIVGPKRLPELGRTIGRGLNEFRKLQDEVKDMVKFDLSEDPVTPSATDAVSYEDPAQEVEDDGTAPADDVDTDERSHSERVIAAMQDDDPTPEPLPQVATESSDHGTEPPAPGETE